jgi:hypothetical protein
MKLEDALFNWLQIKVVADARTNDHAARETVEFFYEVLTEDHHITELKVERPDDTMYQIRYTVDGKSKMQMFDREAVDKLLADIQSEPKYNRQ